MYISLNKLPSGYIPYNEEVKKNLIQIRGLTYGEVMTFSEHKDKLQDIIPFIKERDIIKGIDFEEISVGDWEFIELTLAAISYADPTYTINLGECPKCKEKFSNLPEDELYLKVGPERISKIPKLTRKVTHGEINFKELPKEITSEAEITLEDGKQITVDFFRLKHYKSLSKDQENFSIIKKVEALSGISINDITSMDYATLLEAIELMSHGLDSSFNVVCPSCAFTKIFTFQWRLLQLRSFSFDNQTIRDRILFGKVRKHEPAVEPELSRSKSSLRQSG